MEQSNKVIFGLSLQVTIEVEKGSGYFYLREVESQVLQVSYLTKSKSVLVRKRVRIPSL